MARSNSSFFQHIERIRPLMVPASYAVIPEPILQFDRRHLRRALNSKTRNQPLTVKGRIVLGNQTRANTAGAVALVDTQGNRLHIPNCAESSPLYKILAGYSVRLVCLYGRVYLRDAHWCIENPEPIPSRWIGRPRPFYDLHPSTRRSMERRGDPAVVSSYLGDAKVQNEFRRKLRHMRVFRFYMAESRRELFQNYIKDDVCRRIGFGDRDQKACEAILDDVLKALHAPTSRDHLVPSWRRMRRIAAVGVIASQVKEGVAARLADSESEINPATPMLSLPKDGGSQALVARYAATLPFKPTDEQAAAAGLILDDLGSGRPMRRVLSGDVGTGKTAVYAIAAMAMVEHGFRVGVMLPSSILAAQVADKLGEMMPDTPMMVIAGDTRRNDDGARLHVGTVGLNSNVDEPLDLLICDEQQRFSREQREALINPEAHLLEATATCIPRTQALMDTSHIDVCRLRKPHASKRITTRLWTPLKRATLFSEISKDIDNGHRVIVIYPGKNSSDKNKTRVYAVKDFEHTWEKRFPGNVALCHGGQSSEENDNAVASVRSGEKQILVGTSVLEVGIDIPGVHRVVIVQPDRFGLSPLHQFRGRCAREGGRGYCDLMLVGDISDRARRRLEFLCSESDGFKLAEFDLSNRGAGDTTRDGNRQSGALPKSPFVGFEPDRVTVSAIAEELATAYEEEILSRSFSAQGDDGNAAVGHGE